ncbi:hypothetical protein Btru_072529 [Bulinus truncatus]|nr:hypothetical protein Btru_072529 [Bulinus truncatus]
MAERGVDDDNPFSFKSFVNVKEKKTTKAGNSLFYDTEDIFDAGDQSVGNIPSKKENLVEKPPTKSGLNGVGKKDQEKENPFSFKKFLSSSTNKVKRESDPSLITTSKNVRYDDLFQEDPVFELCLESQSKPDNHLLGKPVEDLNTDITQISRTNPITCDLLAESKLGDSSDERLQTIHDLGIPFLGEPDESVDISLSSHDKKQKLPLALPDFLSDGAAMRFPLGSEDVDHSSEDLLEKIKTLEEENAVLRRELSREKQMNNEKSQRLIQLSVDLERQKKKEAEETAVLEKAVLQVEENLVTTTKRAVQAEANVTLLKKENKMLQNQVNSLLLMNESLKSGDKGLSELKERTKYTSEQLMSASAIAEKNINELKAGVDKLKLLSQVLASIDKVSEFQKDPTYNDF